MYTTHALAIIKYYKIICMKIKRNDEKLNERNEKYKKKI